MILKNEANPVNMPNSRQFSIDTNNAKIFNILSDKLYANKIGSIIRELVTNAFDAHKEVSQTRPVELYLNKAESSIFMDKKQQSCFVLRDFGTGLSEEEVYNLYTVYGRSTKAETNDFIGAFGIGSKVPFCYTQSFEITSFQNGIKKVYIAFHDKNNINSISKILEEETTEPNGLSIKIHIKSDTDFNEFVEEAKYFLSIITDKSLLSLYINDELYENQSILLYEDEKIKIVKNDLLEYEGYSFLIDNKLSYPVKGLIKNVNEVSSQTYVQDAINCAKKFFDIVPSIIIYNNNIKILFKVNVGDIDLNASREEIEKTKNSYENSVRIFKEAELSFYKALFSLKEEYKFLFANTEALTKPINKLLKYNFKLYHEGKVTDENIKDIIINSNFINSTILLDNPDLLDLIINYYKDLFKRSIYKISKNSYWANNNVRQYVGGKLLFYLGDKINKFDSVMSQKIYPKEDYIEREISRIKSDFLIFEETDNNNVYAFFLGGNLKFYSIEDKAFSKKRINETINNNLKISLPCIITKEQGHEELTIPPVVRTKRVGIVDKDKFNVYKIKSTYGNTSFYSIKNTNSISTFLSVEEIQNKDVIIFPFSNNTIYTSNTKEKEIEPNDVGKFLEFINNIFKNGPFINVCICPIQIFERIIKIRPELKNPIQFFFDKNRDIIMDYFDKNFRYNTQLIDDAITQIAIFILMKYNNYSNCSYRRYTKFFEEVNKIDTNILTGLEKYFSNDTSMKSHYNTIQKYKKFLENDYISEYEKHKNNNKEYQEYIKLINYNKIAILLLDSILDNAGVVFKLENNNTDEFFEKYNISGCLQNLK